MFPTSHVPGERLRHTLTHWQNRVREPALTALLLGQLALIFVVSPLSSARVFTFSVVNAVQVLLLGISYFTLPQGSSVRGLIVVCLLPMLWVSCVGSNHYVGLLLRMVVTLSITGAVGQAVFRAQRVTLHQLLGAVVVYLNIPLLFMGAFILLDMTFAGAFTTSAKAALQPGELLYFSLTTVTSTGYGDILPVHPLARSLANLEAIIGQLYLAILLARLVSLHLSKAAPNPAA